MFFQQQIIAILHEVRLTTKEEKIKQYDMNAHKTLLIENQGSMWTCSKINLFVDLNISVFYLQFTIKVFQIYFLISVNEEIFMMINKIFVKHILLFILGERFFVYLIDVFTGNNFGGSWILQMKYCLVFSFQYYFWFKVIMQ